MLYVSCLNKVITHTCLLVGVVPGVFKETVAKWRGEHCVHNVLLCVICVYSCCTRGCGTCAVIHHDRGCVYTLFCAYLCTCVSELNV